MSLHNYRNNVYKIKYNQFYAHYYLDGITNNNQICYKSYLSLIWHPLSSVLCYKYMQENQTKRIK